MHGRGITRALVGLVALVSAPLAVVALGVGPAGATTVNNEAQFRTAFADAAETSITLGANITLTCGPPAAAQRTSATALTIDGGGTFSITQSCANNQNLVQNGSGAINLVGVTLHGGNTGVSSVSGPVTLTNSTIETLTDAASQVTGVNAGGSVTLDHSTINGLVGTNAALGILSFGTSVAVTNGSFITNIAGTGSATGVSASGDVVVTDSTVGEVGSANLASALGSGSGTISATRAHLGPVTSDSTAFGIVASAGPVTFDQSTLDGVAGSAGLAIGITGTAGLGVHGSTVANVESSGSVAVGIQVAGGVTLADSLVRAVTSKTNAAIGVATDSAGSVDATVTTVADITAATNAAGIAAGSSVTLTDSSIQTVTAPGGDSAVGVGGDHVIATGTEVSGVGNSGFSVGIEATIELTLTRSTITGTTGTSFAAGAEVGGPATVVNSTITDNQGYGVVADGDLTAVYSDIVGNGVTITPTAAPAARAHDLAVPGSVVGSIPLPAVGGVHAQASLVGQLTADGTLTLFGTVLAKPVGSFENCPDAQTTVSAGYNFADDTSCALTGTGDRQGAGLDPQLRALAFNGGPTQTLAITQTSPLFDAIPAAACQAGPAAGITTDQRGEARPSYTGCDIGAFEIQAPTPIDIAPRFTG